jgi:glycine betaine/proline transport system ATP-binding protein
MREIAVDFKNVDIVFGKRQAEAIQLLDAGHHRGEILEKTGCVIGVADASIAIERGEVCVLMGLSGSGKSTLLRAVNGLNKVTRGEVWVDDGGGRTDVAHCDEQTLRRLRRGKVAMVFQQFALLPWRTVRENVGFGLELRGMAKAERDAIVDEKLKLVRLEQWAGKYGHQLSGGMQQRVGLARAFATDAEILLMDEPFSALDPLIREHLQDELLDLQKTVRKTIVFVSHDLDEALKIGTHIAIMEGGRIVQYGEPEEIVLQPANEYVADFVAHMNPLKVLTGGSLMTPLERLDSHDGLLVLDSRGHIRLSLDTGGAPVAVSIDGRPGRIVPYSESLDLEGLPEGTFVTASPDLKMRDAVRLRRASGTPVLFLAEGRFVGVCGDEEIYGGILRQTRANETKAG